MNGDHDGDDVPVIVGVAAAPSAPQLAAAIDAAFATPIAAPRASLIRDLLAPPSSSTVNASRRGIDL